MSYCTITRYRKEDIKHQKNAKWKLALKNIHPDLFDKVDGWMVSSRAAGTGGQGGGHCPRPISPDSI